MIALGVDREAMLMVEDCERTVLSLVPQLKLTRFQHRAVRGAERCDRQFALQGAIRRRPSDIEEVDESRCSTVFQHVHPSVVFGTHHTDVIGHEIKDVGQRAPTGYAASQSRASFPETRVSLWPPSLSL